MCEIEILERSSRPTNPQEGQLWRQIHESGHSTYWRYTDGSWVITVSEAE